MIPAASGAEAEVPVCFVVQARIPLPGMLRSVVTMLGCMALPLLYVVARVEGHSSRYQGLEPS